MAWQFAIDVGGTFTDCFSISPEGKTRCIKVLSSGLYKGRVDSAVSATQIKDSRRLREPDNLWSGSKITLFPEGQSPRSAQIVDSCGASGTLKFDQPMTCHQGASREPVRYEISMGEPAPLVAIRHTLGLSISEKLPDLELRLGTTRGTNALLTRSGARTALITTLGFKDTLTIGYQNRPNLFDLNITRSGPLYDEVIEVNERISAEGTPLQPPSLTELRLQLSRLQKEGFESIAICLLNAYLNSSHEKKVAELCHQFGFKNISVSHQIAPLIKLVERGQTAVMDAYLNPILNDYLHSIAAKLSRDSILRLMTSAGDLVSMGRFSGKDSLLSGPAGGVIALANIARNCANQQAIGFDMGGTSTDVSRFDGRFELETETVKADLSVYAPTLAIETVAAGGGSVCWYEGGMLRVGPQSAGADPGPACYGRGGPLSITDLNVWLGRVTRDQFPFDLDLKAVEQHLEGWRRRLVDDGHEEQGLMQLALGWLKIANSKMAEAIRQVSIVKGYDPRDFALVAFGGAAGQHACAVADELGMQRVLFPKNASLLSAVGMSLASLAGRVMQGVYRPIKSNRLDEFKSLFQELQQNAEQRLREQDYHEHPTIKRTAEIRYQLTESALLVDEPSDGDYVRAFEQQHLQLFGYLQDRPLELCSIQVVATNASDHVASSEAFQPTRRLQPAESVEFYSGSEQMRSGVISRGSFRPGDCIAGPVMVHESTSTLIVDRDWELQVLPSGHLELVRDKIHQEPLAKVTVENPSTASDPVQLEIFSNQFQAIAEQMGATLRKTASSVNVKERLDYSCALFDSNGNLVVNAPHIPVHLGAMSETVRCLIRDCPHLKPGEAYLTNDPYLGGSHLPDLTVVSPVFLDNDEALQRPTFFVASRAHHAEIGGITPGSMPPFSTRLGEEGVIFRHFRIADSGTFHSEALHRALTTVIGVCDGDDRAESGKVTAEYPSRSPAENIRDIKAQLAANTIGIRELKSLCRQKGAGVVLAFMKQLQHVSRSAMTQVFEYLGDGERTFADQLDDGSKIQIQATIQNQRLSLDFAGTSDVHAGNFNANRGIVSAAVMYVLRCLLTHASELHRSGWFREFRSDASSLESDFPTVSHVPLNHGLLESVDLQLPVGMLNPPAHENPEQSPAVVGGNVETSQRIVDVLLGVFGISSASQGTMNNTLFGNSDFGYYETICGGAGANCFSDGATAVHTHMTNTRITDPEVFESRFPARIKQFSIRQGSGGDGLFHGGDGVTREIEFLEDLDVSLLTNRRTTKPFGIEEGESGKPGCNTVLSPSTSVEVSKGSIQELDSSAQLHVKKGTVLRIETPGGGGFGKKS